MDNSQIAEKWLRAFAADVPQEELQTHVLDDYNFLWHVFSWELVPCLTGKEARRVFDMLKYDQALIFYSGYSQNGPQITDVGITGKIKSHMLEKYRDVYITDVNFGWTYVQTHESDCGPYFYQR